MSTQRLVQQTAAVSQRPVLIGTTSMPVLTTGGGTVLRVSYVLAHLLQQSYVADAVRSHLISGH